MTLPGTISDVPSMFWTRLRTSSYLPLARMEPALVTCLSSCVARPGSRMPWSAAVRTCGLGPELLGDRVGGGALVGRLGQEAQDEVSERGRGLRA